MSLPVCEYRVTQSCPTLLDTMDDSQAPLSVGFSRQEYWLPFPTSGGLPDPMIEPVSRALADGFFATARLGSPVIA